jgi:DNA-binding response OmpR family regulator
LIDIPVEELPVAARRILIVEDETMIAMMVEDFLEELGWDVVGWAGGTERALAMARDADIDAALLDVNLGGEDIFAVADILSERHIPFVFATGCGADGMADRFRGVPTLTKPFLCDELDRALHRATAGVCSFVEGRFADPGSRASPGGANSLGR